ncbi:hypothetical protein DUI87_17033 [Hirundo rustica rustica]|uniref:Ig-like domain-containing protein n=1 Tax=Hirundo rustica rustica TaxID=333673 RepID=A0A3M0K2P9_HIRRU|nr:hypothetical protein DUI87_17033 [Hirundo rustica rustica]
MLAVVLALLPGVGIGEYIAQWPVKVIQKAGASSTISCFQDYTDLAYMFWYLQPPRNGLKLIVVALTACLPTNENEPSVSRLPVEGVRQMRHLAIAGVGVALYIAQWPETILQRAGASSTISCFQNYSDLAYMFWYLQPPRNGLKLIVSSTSWRHNSYEDGYSETKFEVNRESSNDILLTIKNVTSKDEATYFCAVVALTACLPTNENEPSVSRLPVEGVRQMRHLAIAGIHTVLSWTQASLQSKTSLAEKRNHKELLFLMRKSRRQKLHPIVPLSPLLAEVVALTACLPTNENEPSVSRLPVEGVRQMRHLAIAGVGVALYIAQWPETIIQRAGASSTISCFQNYSNLAYMFWYLQPPRNGLKLIVSSSTWSHNSYEDGYSEAKFEVNRERKDYILLTIKNVTSKDEATYFCAASDHTV